jgi:hypothetical protein
MTNPPVESHAQSPVRENIIRADSSSSTETPLSITSTKSSSRTTSRHARYFSLSALETSSSSKHKLFQSRSRSPAALGTTDSQHKRRAESPPGHIYSTNPQPTESPAAMSPTVESPTDSTRPAIGKRFSDSISNRKASNDHKRYSGTINHYGRHSNDWLFGGFSVRDSLRDGIDKLLNHDDKE